MKIRNVKPKSSSNNYRLLFDSGNQIGTLITKIHSATIRLGNKLEKTFNSFFETKSFHKLETSLLKKGWCLFQLNYKTNQLLSNIRPDFIFVNHQAKICYVLEMKLGNMFDTKKAKGELSSLETSNFQLKTFFEKRGLKYKHQFYFCCFFSSTKQEIIKGFKNKIAPKNVLTGKELCKLLGLNFDVVVSKMNLDPTSKHDNLVYLIEELLAIEKVALEIKRQTKEKT